MSFRFAYAALICTALTACSGAGEEAPSGAAAEAATGIRVPPSLVAVPLVRQKTDYSCGDAAALALLRYWRFDRYSDVPEEALYAPLHTTAKDGTDPQPIANYLDTVDGVSAEYVAGAAVTDLLDAVDRGEPPIVDLQAWQSRKKDWATDWDDGHYVVMVGYDAKSFFFMDPSTPNKYAYIPRADFESRWHDVVGKHDAHVEHMAIFVHGAHATAAATVPPRATRID